MYVTGPGELNGAAWKGIGFGAGSRFLGTVPTQPMHLLGQRCLFSVNQRHKILHRSYEF